MQWHICGPAGSRADPDAALFEFGRSFSFDRRLFEDDVTGSLAWADGARARRRADARRTRPPSSGARGRARRAAAIRRSSIRRRRRNDEDVHAFVERELVARVGDAGRRLHTGPLAQRTGRARSAALPQAARAGSCSSAIVALVAVLADQRRSRRRCADAVLHAPAPRAADSGRALLSRARRGAPPRPRALRGAARRSRRAAARLRAPSPAPATPSTSIALAARLGFSRIVAQQHRRHRRSRLRLVVPPRLRR